MTLPEVLVAMGLLSLVTGLLVVLYGSSASVVEHGAGRAGLQQDSRILLRRVAGYLETAMPQVDGSAAILSPASGASAAQIEFTSTADLLGDQSVDPRVPNFFTYRIRRDGQGGVFLERTGSPPQRIAHGIKTLRFTNRGTSVRVEIEVEVKVRNARRQERTLEHQLDTVVYIPYYFTTSAATTD